VAVSVGGVNVAHGSPALLAGAVLPLGTTASVGGKPGVLVNGIKVGANTPPEVGHGVCASAVVEARHVM
jgi:hypothetical protein